MARVAMRYTHRFPGGTFAKRLQQAHDALPATGGIVNAIHDQTREIGARVVVTKRNVVIWWDRMGKFVDATRSPNPPARRKVKR